MRREAMVLGHPRLTFALKAELKVQSIGSGAKYSLVTESLRGWDFDAEFINDSRPGYNPMTLLEIWIEDPHSGQTIYGFAKYIAKVGNSGMTFRLVEIDAQGRDLLQKMLDRTKLSGDSQAAV